MTTTELIPGTRLRRIGDFKTPDFVTRYTGQNPVLSHKQVPYDSTNTHNCGVIAYGAGFVMLFRNDFREAWGNPRNKGSNIGIADSPDGVNWKVRPEPTPMRGLDPRITAVAGRYYINCARGGGAATYVTDDFHSFDEVENSLPGNRNQVIFPEPINGLYYRLERPMWQPMMELVNTGTAPGGWVGPTWDIWISQSPDLIHWGQSQVLLKTDQLDYANAKIGAGAPPIRTAAGWLCLIHGDDIDPRRGQNGWEDQWFGRYHAGVMLLDLDDPRKLIACANVPLLTPETELECAGGYRNNVVFITAAYLDANDDLIMYYGAADTYICMAKAPLKDVIHFCRHWSNPMMMCANG